MSKTSEPLPPVVVNVFEDFLKRLAKDPSIRPAITERLRKCLIDNQESSVDALRQALFSEEHLP